MAASETVNYFERKPHPALSGHLEWVVFENAGHDFPQRIIYWVSGDGSLHAKIEGKIKGEPASEEWTWRRSAL